MSGTLDMPAAAMAGEGSPLTWRDCRGTVRRQADELLSTDAVRRMLPGMFRPPGPGQSVT
jgi:hypothetical protein